VIGDSEVTFEGLVQADMYWYDDDFAHLSSDGADGRDGDYEMRRAELVLKGKGPGNIEWVAGYDAKADKWLDVNVEVQAWRQRQPLLPGRPVQAAEQLEELSSTKNNDFISQGSVTNTFGIARRLGPCTTTATTTGPIRPASSPRELTEHPAPTPHGPGWGVRGYWAPINEAGSIFHIGPVVQRLRHLQATRAVARPSAGRPVQPHRRHRRVRNTDRISTSAFESFWVHGPFKLQGEYMDSDTSRYRSPARLLGFGRLRVPALWNITGETWVYKGRARRHPAAERTGQGHVAAGPALRHDRSERRAPSSRAPHRTQGGRLRLGGKMDSWTFGVNWYWRSNFKFLLNYVKGRQLEVHRHHERDVRERPGQQQRRVQPRRGRQPGHPGSARPVSTGNRAT
jgi:phosphate-selective porin OprO/OprP